MKDTVLKSLGLVVMVAALLLGACMPMPAAPLASAVATPAPSGPPAPAVEWQTYTDAEVGYSIEIPVTWSNENLPDLNDGAIHGMAFTGSEGGVEVYWGIGFGGACPEGTEPVQLAQGDAQACHTTQADGTEVWSQIGYEVDGGNSFSVRAYTSDAAPYSRDLVLQVLATLTFMPPEESQTGAAIANPASQNCIEQGGKLEIEERGDLGQIGVCYFEDNLQCEEWALMRGDCPVGGVKVTGYFTPAARYCAITGGEYAVTGNSGAEDEQGTCTFKDGSQCDAWDYYDGKCVAGVTPAPTEGEATIQPLSMEVCDGQAQAMAHFLNVLEVTQSDAPLGDPVSGTSGTGCQATATGTGEEFESPDAVMKVLDSMLVGQGWVQDPMLAAGGPTGIGQGYRKEDQICLALAQWQPDDSANCPKDQPISACEVTPEQQVYTITLNCGLETPSGETAAPVATDASAETARVPLKDAVANMEPQDVWQNFYDLTQIPRPSHHEEQVRAFLVQFGEGLGLETIVDEVGNVLIRKPASPGMENRRGVILQAHMDMVPQKTPESARDPLTDPIDAYVEDGWVMADGTTLGADDGSGVAIAMAILASKTLELGPIEALFTVNEEDGMDGAMGLEASVLQGNVLINLDSEKVGEFTIGSAGGEYAQVSAEYEQLPVPDGASAFTIAVRGLQGGHSGVDIDKGRGHATKLLVRFLKGAAAEYDARIASLASGTAANAIPREASALVVVPADQADAFVASVGEFEATMRAELAAVEPALSVQATPTDLPANLMAEGAQAALIDLLYANPQGVLRMSDGVPGLVETSTNIGIVNVADGQAEITMLSRSSVDSELADVGQMVASVWNLAGVDVDFSGRYSGWNPNPDSPILLLMQQVYEDMYGEEPTVIAVHAGLECGTVVSKYPGMDAISIGPNLEGVHTPSERMEVASVKKLYDFLIETLKQIPEK